MSALLATPTVPQHPFGDSSRPSRTTGRVIRLADEGVPQKAIARALKIPFGEVADTIQEAAERGEIACKPPVDWPVGQIRYAPPAEPVTVPRANGVSSMQEAREAVPRCLRLTTHEEGVIAALLLRDGATKNFIFSAIYGLRDDGGPQTKIIDVFICHLRRKLRPFDIAIETMWGRGYRLLPNDKAKIIALRRAEIEEATTALAMSVNS